MSEKQTKSNFQYLFRNKNFRSLWLGQAISALGDRFTQMSFLTIVMILSADTGGKMAMITFFSLLPFLLFGQFFGDMADRMKRKKLMIIADIARAALILVIPFIRAQSDSIFVMYLVVFVIGTFSALFSPAKMAFIPNIVSKERLVAANSLVAGTGMVATLIGTLIAGIIIKLLGVNISFFVNSATFLISVFMIINIAEDLDAHKKSSDEHSKRTLDNIKEGLVYIKKHILIQRIIQLSFAFSVISSFFYISMLNYGVVHLKQDSAGVGVLLACLGVGMTLGAVWIGRKVGRINYNHLLTLGFLCIGLANIFFVFSPDYKVSIALLFFTGIGGSFILVLLDSILQRAVPDNLRGKIFATKGILGNIVFLTGLLCIGALINLIGIRWIFLFMAAVSLSTAFLVYSAENEFGYQILRMILRLILRIWFDFRISGIENVPRERRVILAGNHTSLLDAVVVMAAYPHRVYFMAREDVLKQPILGWLIRWLGTIPVKVGSANKEALVEAIRVLEQRKTVGIFPEGRLSANGNLVHVKKGVGILAQKGQAQVVPFAIEGAFEAWARGKKRPQRFPVEIRFAKPVKDFESESEELTEEVMNEVARVKREMEVEGYIRVNPNDIIRHIIYPAK